MEKNKNVKYGLLGVAALLGILGFALLAKGWGLLLLAAALGAFCTALGMFLGEASKGQVRDRTHTSSTLAAPRPGKIASPKTTPQLTNEPYSPSSAPKRSPKSARTQAPQRIDRSTPSNSAKTVPAKTAPAKTIIRTNSAKPTQTPAAAKDATRHAVKAQQAAQKHYTAKPQPKKHTTKPSASPNSKKAAPVQKAPNVDPSKKTPSVPHKVIAKPKTPINTSPSKASSSPKFATHKPIPAPNKPHTQKTKNNNTPRKLVITQLGSYNKLFGPNRKNSEKSAFAHFYFKGSEGETFETPFQQLADMATPEAWNYERPEFQRPNQYLPILRRYLNYTFLRLQSQRKIEITTLKNDTREGEVRACFNTGLQTSTGGKDIFAVFSKNDKAARDNDFPEWWFRGWHDSYSSMLTGFRPLPEVATYVSDNSDLVFDTSYDIDINFEHIIEDPKNRDRLPQSLRNDSTLAINAVRGAAAYLKQKHRNNRMMAIPFWYPEHEKIQFLLPLRLTSAAHEVLALVADKQESDRLYKIRTALTMDMAYSNARLVGKPNREWLNP